jgi:hypothetical protein
MFANIQKASWSRHVRNYVVDLRRVGIIVSIQYGTSAAAFV